MSYYNRASLIGGGKNLLSYKNSIYNNASLFGGWDFTSDEIQEIVQGDGEVTMDELVNLGRKVYAVQTPEIQSVLNRILQSSTTPNKDVHFFASIGLIYGMDVLKLLSHKKRNGVDLKGKYYMKQRLFTLRNVFDKFMKSALFKKVNKVFHLAGKVAKLEAKKFRKNWRRPEVVYAPIPSRSVLGTPRLNLYAADEQGNVQRTARNRPVLLPRSARKQFVQWDSTTLAPQLLPTYLLAKARRDRFKNWDWDRRHPLEAAMAAAPPTTAAAAAAAAALAASEAPDIEITNDDAAAAVAALNSNQLNAIDAATILANPPQARPRNKPARY